MFTVNDIPNGGETGASYRPFVDIHCLRLPMKVKQEDVASDIEDGIDTSGKQ